MNYLFNAKTRHPENEVLMKSKRVSASRKAKLKRSFGMVWAFAKHFLYIRMVLTGSLKAFAVLRTALNRLRSWQPEKRQMKKLNHNNHKNDYSI